MRQRDLLESWLSDMYYGSWCVALCSSSLARLAVADEDDVAAQVA